MENFPAGLPQGLSKSDTGAIVRNVVYFLGAALVLVVVGVVVLAWFDKTIPDVISVIAGSVVASLGAVLAVQGVSKVGS